MALTINTNISSLVVQSNLNNATSKLNNAIERMTTGYKINHASDNAAGYSIARNWDAKLGSLDVAADNAATGADMLSTLEDHYALISTHIQRVRDLTEQAANGTYGTQSKQAIQAEIQARVDEIDRIAKNCEFGGQNLMNGDLQNKTIAIQVGLDSNSDKSQIALSGNLFKSGELEALFTDASVTTARANIAKFCADLDDAETGRVSAADMLVRIDKVIDKIRHKDVTKKLRSLCADWDKAYKKTFIEGNGFRYAEGVFDEESLEEAVGNRNLVRSYSFRRFGNEYRAAHNEYRIVSDR